MTRQGYWPGRENPRRDPETERGAAETPGQGKGGAVTLAPRLLGAPQRWDRAPVTLGRPPCGPPGPAGPPPARAIPGDSRLARSVHQIDHWGQVHPVGSGGLGSQAARPPGKPQTGPRPPAHTHPPAPTYATNELGFGPQNRSLPLPDCLAPGAGRVVGVQREPCPSPPGHHPPARPCRAGEPRRPLSCVLTPQGQVKLAVETPEDPLPAAGSCARGLP